MVPFIVPPAKGSWKNVGRTESFASSVSSHGRESGWTLNGCKTGDAKITGGYNLPAYVGVTTSSDVYQSTDRKHVIHAVGPIYSPDQAAHCERLLESCYKVSLKLAVANGCETIVSMTVLALSELEVVNR